MLIVNNLTDHHLTAHLVCAGLRGEEKLIKQNTSEEVPAIKKDGDGKQIYVTRCGMLTCHRQPNDAQTDAFSGNIIPIVTRVNDKTCVAEITERLHLVLRYGTHGDP